MLEWQTRLYQRLSTKSLRSLGKPDLPPVPLPDHPCRAYADQRPLIPLGACGRIPPRLARSAPSLQYILQAAKYLKATDVQPVHHLQLECLTSLFISNGKE